VQDGQNQDEIIAWPEVDRVRECVQECPMDAI